VWTSSLDPFLTTQHCTVWTVLYCTVLYCTVLCCLFSDTMPLLTVSKANVWLQGVNLLFVSYSPPYSTVLYCVIRSDTMPLLTVSKANNVWLQGVNLLFVSYSHHTVLYWTVSFARDTDAPADGLQGQQRVVPGGEPHFWDQYRVPRPAPSVSLAPGRSPMTSRARGSSIVNSYAVQINQVWHCNVLYCTELCCTVCTALYCAVLYCAVLYCPVLYCALLYCTVLSLTVLYCTDLH